MAPCDLPPGADGDPSVFFSKVTGFGFNDMIALPTLTKESLLQNLERRFKSEIVYTYVGDIVVSVNPFKNTGSVGKVTALRPAAACLVVPHHSGTPPPSAARS